MRMDFRQIVAGFLTMSMFIMLGNMIYKDHIDPFFPVNLPEVSVGIQHNVFNFKLSSSTTSLWKEQHIIAMKPCWKRFSAIRYQGAQKQGYVFFTLTNGPEYHALQVANAIFIAKHLGAELVLPDIEGSNVREKRSFGEIYDTRQFITSLQDVIHVVNYNESTADQRRENIFSVKVPEAVTKEFVSSMIEPTFRKTRHVKLITSPYPSLITLTGAYQRSSPNDDFKNPYACLAIFESLRLKSELQELMEMMVRTLQFMSMKSSGGKFVALDLRFDDIEKEMMSCQMATNGTTIDKQPCYGVKEIGQWMKKIGFGMDITIYITQTGWHQSLQPFREYYPNIFIKDSLMPIDMKARYLTFKNFQYEKYIDWYLCIEGNVFVPTSPSLFYANVAGLRIALGNTQIIAPPTARRFTSTSEMDHLSPFVLNKTHVAYSCLC